MPAKTKTKKTQPTKRKPKTKKTDQLVWQIIQYRKQRLNYLQIARQLNMSHVTVKQWYYEAINVASPQERAFMRSEETELNEEIIRDCKQDLRDIENPVQPDWAEYKNNSMARAKAYETWLNAKDRVFDKKQKAYNTMARCSKNIIDINGLHAPTRIEIEEVNKQQSLSEEFAELEQFVRDEIRAEILEEIQKGASK